MKAQVTDLRPDTDVAAFRNMRIIKEWRFRPLKLNDKAQYDEYAASTAFPIDIWSSNFAFLWAQSRKPDKLTILRSEVDGMLVTWILSAKGRLYLPCLPIGPGDPEQVISVLARCEKLCVDWNQRSGYTHKPVVAKLSSNQLEYFQQFDSFNSLFKPKLLTGIERHLSIASLTSLTGKRFSSIRYKLNKFQREFPNARLRYYQSNDFDAVLQLGNQWKETSGTKHQRILDDFYFKDTLKNHQALGLENLVVEIDGQIIGVTIGGLLPNGQAWGYLTKFDSSFDGISEYMVIAMALRIRELDSNVELINVGTDFGNQKLATAKEKYRPVKAYQRYALKSLRST
jgi:hypothetical protein